MYCYCLEQILQWYCVIEFLAIEPHFKVFFTIYKKYLWIGNKIFFLQKDHLRISVVEDQFLKFTRHYGNFHVVLMVMRGIKIIHFSLEIFLTPTFLQHKCKKTIILIEHFLPQKCITEST